MSPEQREDFETEWPGLAERLCRLLSRRGISAAQAEDVVQETGLRLYGCWETVDRSRPAWPLARTIALNHLRDQARRRIEEVVIDLPDVPHAHDVETRGMALLELHLVRAALDELTPAARAAVLSEIGNGDGAVRRATDAEKMQRMRARRKLRRMLGKMPALLPFRLGKLGELGQGLLGRASIAEGLGCAACLALGIGIAPMALAPASSAAYPSHEINVSHGSATADATDSDLYGLEGVDVSQLREARLSGENGTKAARRRGGGSEAASGSETGRGFTPPDPVIPEGPEGVPTGSEELPTGGNGPNATVAVASGDDDGRESLPPLITEAEAQAKKILGTV
jgi:hypothetical protein